MQPTPDQRLAERLPPSLPSVMHQQWTDLLFLHWHFHPDVIQNTLPPGLTVDTFDHHAWVAIVPFFMRGVRPRFCPPVPGLSDFLELNLRTYVFDESGRPGVWFYSLDCNQSLAVRIARTLFHLPYQHATMNCHTDAKGWLDYRSTRRGDSAESRFRYRLTGSPRAATLGSLDFFLTERYRLFAHGPRGLRSGQVHHHPYPLVQADVSHWDDSLFALNGFAPPQRPPDHIIGSHVVRVTVHPLTR